ncbi:alpha/beta hydrolase, partial [Azospirillum brasilense]|nr:alpha/beta hydrolase [Azospirillum brasilense]
PGEVANAPHPRVRGGPRAVLLDIGGRIPFPLLPGRGVAVAVLGAEKDRLIPKDQVEATARAFRTEPVFFPAMGHSMMLEPGWESVAGHIADWVETAVLKKPAPQRRTPDTGVRAAAD